MAKRVFLAPSDQWRNEYAYGGTSEAIQCGRIAEATKAALERNGIEAQIGHMIEMEDKCRLSDEFKADLHMPIHTNAYNGTVSGTRMFYYSASVNGKKACQTIFNRLAPVTPGESENIKPYDGLYEVHTPKAPTVYVEVDFHDVPSVAKWIIENTETIAESLTHGICDYFGITYTEPSNSTGSASTSTESSSVDMITISLPRLKKGAHNSYVKTVQILLNKKNNAGLDEDCGFGTITYNAVLAYQKKNNLDADGVVGPQTWKHLLG